MIKSIVRGFGGQIGRTAANKVMKSPNAIDSAWKGIWNFVKWCIILTFLYGMFEGFFGK